MLTSSLALLSLKQGAWWSEEPLSHSVTVSLCDSGKVLPLSGPQFLYLYNEVIGPHLMLWALSSTKDL
jgi:hypothetical protein